MHPLPQSATDELWMRMASRYGHAWVSQYGPLPDGIVAAEWRDTLKGITHEQLRAGFAEDAMRAADWPPTSTRFRAMCLDIPTMATVRLDIDRLVRALLPLGSHGHGSREVRVSRFARVVWSYINSYEFRNESGRRADRMLREAYELASAYIMDGGELPVEPVALIAEPEKAPPSPEQERRTKAAAAEALSKISEMLKTEPAKPFTEVEDEHDSAA
jgi:hypothetical protein